MFENFLQFLDVTNVLIIVMFFLLLEYRPPWWWWWNRKQFKNKQINKNNLGTISGPFSLPLLGTCWQFIIGKYQINQMHLYYEDMYKKYGSIMKEEMLFNVPIINLFEKTEIEKVFKSTSKYPQRPPCEAVAQYRKSRPDRYSTTGLVNEQGEAWYKLRSALTPSLTSPKTISSFLPQVNQIADDWCYLIKHLRTSDNRLFNLEKITDRLGLELTCALVLGRRMGFLLPDVESEIAKKLAQAVHDHFIANRDTYYGIPLWKLYKTQSYKRLEKSEETIYSLAFDLIQSADDSTKESVVFQSVLNANIDDKEKTAAIIDFISAGIHTLKNSLLFLLHLVGENHEIQNNILKDPTNKYLKACIQESFRLYPTANPLARILDESIDLGGHIINSGTIVLCHTGIACRDNRNFHQAQQFRPERWLNKEKFFSNNSASYLFTPFGIGRRICPGKRFIEQILPVILNYTVKNFEMTSIEPLRVQFEFLLSPIGEISMNFKDRI